MVNFLKWYKRLWSGQKIEMVELTYSLEDIMLQEMAPDTPHMHVMNDRQSAEHDRVI